uniref:SH2 domain-containing protein n=1 Tax=Caenorhabditis tropicalis TaxID=1561998 RepID=A0A1I7UZR1_9PELO
MADAPVISSDLYGCDWYWGDLDWKWAERLLLLCPVGYFLIRDSRSETHLFTVSYHFQDKVYHSRLSLEDSRRNLGSRQPYVSRDYRNLVEIIERALEQSHNGQQEMLHYRRGREAEAARVNLTRPLTKRELLPSLQYLSRYTIRAIPQQMSMDTVPPKILKYLNDSKWIIPDLKKCEEQLKRRFGI